MVRAGRLELPYPGWKPSVFAARRRQHTYAVQLSKIVATVAEVESAGRGFGDRTSTTASRPKLGGLTRVELANSRSTTCPRAVWVQTTRNELGPLVGVEPTPAGYKPADLP
jgi:hypothetical protein